MEGASGIQLQLNIFKGNGTAMRFYGVAALPGKQKSTNFIYLMQGLIKITRPPDYSYKTSFLFLPDLLIKIKHYVIYNFTFSGRLQLS